MEEALITAGIALIFIGMVLLIAGTLAAGKSNVKFAVGGFIGPFPFGFANSEEMLRLVLLLTLFALIFFTLFMVGGRYV
mgnify:FL=1